MSSSDNSQDTWQKIFQPLVVVLLTGLLAFQLPLQSKRPPTDSGPEPPAGIQLDARLWMDPFDAPERDPNHDHKTSLDDLGGQILRHLNESTHNDKGPFFLAVMVDGGPYFESLERRRRVRYAVISALMDQGYTPEDRDHIRYLHLKYPFNYLDPQTERRVVSQAERRMPENIPYEWYAAPKGSGQAVMVLWLEEDALSERPLDKLRVIKNLLRLGAMRAIKTDPDENGDKSSKTVLQITLSSLLDETACLERNQTEDKSNLCQFQRNWYDAKDIEDKLQKEPPSQVDLANNAVQALNEIKKSLNQKEPCKESNEGQQPSEQLPQSGPASNTVQTTSEPSKKGDCQKNKVPELDLTEESFILRYLGPIRAETELLDELWNKLKNPCQDRAWDMQALDLLAANKVNFQVIGPNASDTLLSMVNNAIQSAKEGQKRAKPQGVGSYIYPSKIPILSPVATVTGKFLDRHLSGGKEKEAYDLSYYISKGYFEFQPTNKNRTDDQLAKILQEELERRGINDGEYIGRKMALIAERDTLYSRGLVDEFRNRYSTGGNAIPEYGYFRGLDGENAKKVENKAQGSGNANNSGQQSAKKYDDLLQNNQPRSFDYAYGDDQIDYLRRIADDLERQERKFGQPIRAIGLMGSDVYDKLLILQALKPRFPSAIFFTTELDARYFDRSAEFGSTGIARNLVVVSGRDLMLDESSVDSRTKKTPKFRSSLQTEYYHAVNYSIQKNNNEAYPKLFEIGATQAIDLNKHHAICDVPSTIILMITPLAVFCFSGYLVSDGFRGVIQGYILPNKYTIMICLTIIVATVWVSDEPITQPTEGISIWPAEVMRLLSILFSCYFIKQIDEMFAAEYPNIVHTAKTLFLWLALPLIIMMMVAMFCPSLYGEKVVVICCCLLWLSVAYSHKPSERPESGKQVIFYASLIAGFSAGFMLASHLPNVPARGVFARALDQIILGCSIACFITLLATVLAVAKMLQKKISKLKPEKIDSIYQIGDMTKDLYKIVWYPFIVASLLLIARSRIFDNWSTPIGLVMIFALSFGLLIVCVLRIRSRALDVKSTLEQTLKREEGGRDTYKDELENLNEYQVGAYGNFLAHPSLGGVTLLLGGSVLPDLIQKLSAWLLG